MKNKFLKFLASEWVLGCLVAVISILIAVAAYQSALFDSQEGDKNVEGQKQLTESNTYYLEANQFVIYDYTMYDGWYINDGKDDELAQYYMDSFSEDLTASMSRSEGPFDDAYYEAMYADADGLYQEAMTAFDEANEAGNKSDQLQLAVLIFAVGLALSAYGSIISEESKLRMFFCGLSILSFVFGLVIYISAL